MAVLSDGSRLYPLGHAGIAGSQAVAVVRRLNELVGASSPEANGAQALLSREARWWGITWCASLVVSVVSIALAWVLPLGQKPWVGAGFVVSLLGIAFSRWCALRQDGDM